MGVPRSILRACTAVCVCAVLLLAGSPRAGAENRQTYSLVRIELHTRAELRQLAALGLALEDGWMRDSSSIQILLRESDIIRVRAAGFAIVTLVPDWQAAYLTRQQHSAPASLLASRVRAFHLGSMGGYLTLGEVEAELDSMHARYPQLAGARDSVGRSIEGRTIWGVRIAGNGAAARPVVLYTALHHAREPAGMMTLVYSMWYLLEQYGLNDDITSLLDTRELYFVPVVNPDGYAYNALTNPGGGGFWRKNRRVNGDGSIGVDVNRNYGYRWGYDDVGSSPLGDDETFRGAAAFSEPETQAIRDLCSARKPACALNYHTFGNLLIHPWGYNDLPTPDSLLYTKLADALTARSYYAYGTGGVTIGYATNGDSDDWMYGETSAKPRVFALTPEVGSNDDGFWPDQARILPIADANLEANIAIAHYAGPYVGVTARTTRTEPGTSTATMNIGLVNLGVGVHPATADVSFTSDLLDVAPPSLSGIAVDDSTVIPLALHPKPEARDGMLATIRVACAFNGGRSQDSLQFRIGTPVVLFTDSANSSNPQWQGKSATGLTTWGFTTRDAFAGNGSYADSPWSDYPNNYSSTFTLQKLLPLFGGGAELHFVAHWDIEPEYDFSLVEGSSDSGRTWFSLPGKYTRPASGASGGKQEAGWGYDRTRKAWVQETIDLARFIGSRAMLRFRFESDGSVQRDGIYIDNIQVLLFGSSVQTVRQDVLPIGMGLGQNYPNPFNPSTNIRYTVATEGSGALGLGSGEAGAGGGQTNSEFRNQNSEIGIPGFTWVRLTVYDVLGREVAVLVEGPRPSGEHTVTWHAEDMSTGVYFYRVVAGSFVDVKKMLLVK